MIGGLIIVAAGMLNAGILAAIGARHNRRYDERKIEQDRRSYIELEDFDASSIEADPMSAQRAGA